MKTFKGRTKKVTFSLFDFLIQRKNKRTPPLPEGSTYIVAIVYTNGRVFFFFFFFEKGTNQL